MANNEIKLQPKERATMRRALIQDGQTTAGLSDTELLARYNQLVGTPLHAQPAPMEEEEPEEQPAPAKTKPKAVKPKPKPKPKTDKAALVAMFEQALNEGPANDVSEARVIELIKQHARPQIISVTMYADKFEKIQHSRLHGLNVLEQELDECDDEVRAQLFDKYRDYLVELDNALKPTYAK